jgi:cytochrome P450
MTPWLHNDFLWSLSSSGKEERANLKILHDFTDTVIQERKEKFAAAQIEMSLEQLNANDEPESVYMTTKQRFAFLDLLISVQRSEKDTLTDEGIREETDTFMFEGHDTTAAALTWCLYLLAKNPEHQVGIVEVILRNLTSCLLG